MTGSELPIRATDESRDGDAPQGNKAMYAPRREVRRAERRDAVAALVDRALDPAVGLCLRAVDRRGEYLYRSRTEAREVVMAALRGVATHGLASDDDAVHRTMRRTAEIALDRMVGTTRTVPLPRGLDLDAMLEGVSAEDLAPLGRLSLAELQDAVAASRAADRQVAFVVLAAGLPPQDAATLLGRRPDELDTSLRRVCRRLAEGHAAVAGAR